MASAREILDIYDFLKAKGIQNDKFYSSAEVAKLEGEYYPKIESKERPLNQDAGIGVFKSHYSKDDIIFLFIRMTDYKFF